MKIVLASEAMEFCAKAMEEDGVDRDWKCDDVRAIYQAAATIQAATPVTDERGQTFKPNRSIPIPDWLAKAGGYA